MKVNVSQDTTEIEGPARITPLHVQDRELTTVAGGPKGWRRLDGLQYLKDRKLIDSNQFQAGERLQNDYAEAQMEAMPRSGTGGSGYGPRDIPQQAIDADRRFHAALAVLPPAILTLTVVFLIPQTNENGEREFLSMEQIAKRVREDKRAIPLAMRTALSLLGRHYGVCS